MSDNEETRIAVGQDVSSRPQDAEDRVFSIGPTLIFIKAGYGLAAIAAIVFVALTAPVLNPIYALPIGVAFLLVPAYRHFRRRLVRYTLTDSKIEIDKGFFVQDARIIPLRSVQDVAVRSGVLQRLMGFGDVVIDNASEDGGKIVLKDIPTPKLHADLILKELRNLHR